LLKVTQLESSEAALPPRQAGSPPHFLGFTLSYSLKESFCVQKNYLSKNEGKLSMFPGKQKLRESITSRPNLQVVLKEPSRPNKMFRQKLKSIGRNEEH